MENNHSTNLLYNLLKIALKVDNIRLSIPSKELEDILKKSREQAVLGLVFNELSYIHFSGVDKALIYQNLSAVEEIKYYNRLVTKELMEFALKCDEHHIDYIVVKGQTIGTLYPKPELRQSGDIDFLIKQVKHKTNNELVNHYSHLFGVEIPVIVEKETPFELHGIKFELHTRLVDFGCKKHKIFFEHLIDNEWLHNHYVILNDVKVRTLSPTINAVYLFLHLFFHFIREGVSLRQFCDWAIFLHHYRDNVNRKKLIDILYKLDIIEGYKAFGCILVDILGIPENDFPMELSSENRRWKNMILNDVFQGGNFGKLNHHAKTAWFYKYETLKISLRNCIRYHCLAPSEMRMMIPKMIITNIKLITKQRL